ncbi:hypothetical protein GGR26_002630 [Lewinella marina]|uniref:Cytochrome B n=1 Tax=Neolewinella marina TaxID=438751 RepID=A0A2G0CDE6_9BACT|nr:cytochrome B [Neolewinella marina]NJB86853.1 hypothetical protein [Neolewinella marina]PHK97947.1 cytochrome B [Neolewinella marina]
MGVLYTAVQHAHSGLRWIVLVLLVAAIGRALSRRSGGTVYPGKDKLALLGLISVHVQLLLGLVLYLWLSPYVRFEGNVMADPQIRFYTVEHFAGMIIAVILITIGYSRAKRQAELNKGWKTIALFYGIGLAIILLSIPWPWREGLMGGWF